MKKRFLSILLSLCMVLALFPATAFAEDNEEPTETPVCTCETVCAAEAMNADCSVCGAEGATIENCGKYVAPVEETEPEQTAVEKVQALIDALPDADTITEENRADVEAQLTAIDEAKLPLGDELDALDFTRYNAAIAVLNELDGIGGAEIPETLEDTLQGDGSATNPWILTQASFDDATDSSSPVSKTVIEGFLTDVLYTLKEGCYKLGEDKDIVLEYTGDGNAKIEIRGIVTLDLNGHTLTQTSSGVAAINVYGTLTLNDSSDDPSSKISGGSIGVDLQTSGQFTMNGGTITGSTIGVNVGSGAMFTMNGGLITVAETGSSCVEVDNDGTFEMKGGKIEASEDAFAIWNEGTLNAEVGTKLCLVKGLVMNLKGGITNGGVFKGPVNNPGGNSGRGTINGGVFYDTVTLEKSKTQINGGVFYGIVVNKNKDDKNPITGGVFFGGITGEGRIVGDQHNITFDLGDGTTRNGFVVGDTLYPLGEPPVTREGFIFNGWYKDAEFTEPWDFTNQDPVEDNMAFYAKWVCAVHSGGTATCEAQAECETCGEPYGALDLTNHVGTLGEWQKDANGHWKTYSCCSTVKGAEGAHSFGEDGKCECGAVQYTVTFDVGGGTVDPTSATTNIEGKLTELPTPTRQNYSFLGWFTKSGELVTTDTVFEANTTVYAHWQINSSSLLPTWQQWELIDKIVAANKKKDETVEVEPEPEETEPVEEAEPTWNNPFTDVAESDAFYEAVKFAFENGYMNGMSENTFAPSESLTRGMLVTVLYRAAGSPVMEDANPFVDVAQDAWYYNAVVWARSIGLVNGITETEFAPDELLTREQLVTIFYRYANFLGHDVSVGEDTNILSYNDAQEISEYAFSAMQWACGESILNGSDGNLMPQGNATRAQVAAILHRFCENILK